MNEFKLCISFSFFWEENIYGTSVVVNKYHSQKMPNGYLLGLATVMKVFKYSQNLFYNVTYHNDRIKKIKITEMPGIYFRRKSGCLNVLSTNRNFNQKRLEHRPLKFMKLFVFGIFLYKIVLKKDTLLKF